MKLNDLFPWRFVAPVPKQRLLILDCIPQQGGRVPRVSDIRNMWRGQVGATRSCVSACSSEPTCLRTARVGVGGGLFVGKFLSEPEPHAHNSSEPGRSQTGTDAGGQAGLSNVHANQLRHLSYPPCVRRPGLQTCERSVFKETASLIGSARALCCVGTVSSLSLEVVILVIAVGSTVPHANHTRLLPARRKG